MNKAALLTREPEQSHKRTPKEYCSPFIVKSKIKGYLVYMPIILLLEGDESSIVTTLSIVNGLIKTFFAVSHCKKHVISRSICEQRYSVDI